MNDDSFFKKAVGLQVSVLLLALSTGTVVTFLVQPHIFTLVPKGGYGPLVSWVVSAGVGYIIGGGSMGIFFMIGVYLIHKSEKSNFKI